MSQQVIPSPSEVAESIQDAWADFVQQDRSVPNKRPYVYASSYWDCLRRMVLDMTHGDKLPAFDADTLARFRRGNDRERDLLSDLKRIGRNAEPSFEVIGEQERFELNDRDGRTVIVGKVDCRLRFPWGDKPPLECKAWHPSLTARINTFEDCFISPWTRKGAYQLLSYLFGAGEPVGFLMLDKSGLPALIPVELDDVNLERMERFLSNATAAMDHAEQGTVPDFHDDPESCKRCDHFGVSCQPPLKYEGAEVIIDEELEQKLERWEEIRENGQEFKKLDKELKSKFRGAEQAIIGSFLLRGKWQKKTSFDLPEEVEKTISDLRQDFQVEDPKGKFVLKITKI